MTLGEYLREKRMERGWTLQKLADKVGCRRQYIHSIEHGDINPSKAKLREIATVLGHDGLALRLYGGDVPQEVIDALICQPEMARLLIDNARRADLSPPSLPLSRSVN
jgi:transcriptional regulator with XRE-family HTH domain